TRCGSPWISRWILTVTTRVGIDVLRRRARRRPARSPRGSRRRSRPRVDAGPPPPQGLDNGQFLSGIAAQQARIESCMGEWLQRKDGEGTTLIITLSVGPDGNVLSTRRAGMDPSDLAAQCAERAVEAATFAQTSAVTHGEVTVVVEAGQIRVSPKKTGATAAGQTIDLD
ncbi:MAG: hypothetical protein L0227_10325, partial [Chloroflexi bacterium]|nr:hypothetical protein [Chloroflexota bacterium]